MKQWYRRLQNCETVEMQIWEALSIKHWNIKGVVPLQRNQTSKGAVELLDNPGPLKGFDLQAQLLFDQGEFSPILAVHSCISTTPSEREAFG